MIRGRHSRLSFVLTLALLFGVLALGVGGTPALFAAGTVSLTTLGVTYMENFDTLASTGTTDTTVPNGWEFSESGGNANTTYRVGTGSDNTGDTYSFGAASNPERAFGGLQSSSLVPLIGVQFTNNTGGIITDLAVSYTGEQWRLGIAGRQDFLDFQLSTDATSLTTGTWADHNALDFGSPVVAGTVGALNGNVAPNRTALSFTISGLSIPNGASFWLRWIDRNVTGADDGLAVDDFSLTPNPPENAPAVLSTNPVNGATDVAPNANLSVTFSEPVNLAAGAFALNCTLSGSKSYAVSNGPVAFAINPDADFVLGESCTLTIVAAGVTDQDAYDPPDVMAADVVVTFTTPPNVDPCTLAFTPAYVIQGSGATAAITGAVTTQGVVVGDYEGPSPALRGFFLQDLTGDGNPATSDGIFVFEGSNADSVNLGDVVRVTGTAGENQGQTQVTAFSILNCGTGSVASVDVMFPVASPTFLEQYEGMLVRLPQEMFVTEHFQLGRFGQVVLSSGGRQAQPTNVVPPGAPAIALQAQNLLNRIILDDALQTQNPDPILFGRGGAPLSASNTLRGGDSVSGIVGVMTFTWAGNSASGNAYRVRPINALGGVVPNFQPTNPRPASAPAPTGRLRVAAMNLLNFFNTFDGSPDTADNCAFGVGGLPADCRGADTQAEFDRQLPKTVAAIVGTGADVIGVNEVENDGYGPDSAMAFLVDKLNAATAPGTYAYLNVDGATGQVNALGTDAIKVGMIYKPGSVTPVGKTAVLNSEAFVNGGDPAPRSRPSLAQAFQENSTGARFIVDVNHLKSKGSACAAPDAGDGQGNCNIVRNNAAALLVAWLAGNPTDTGDPDVLIMGDLNSYAMEDPITTIQSAGYTNLIKAFNPTGAYSYVFDGQWGYLDHALGNAAVLPQVTGIADWHINADEPGVLDYNTDFKTANLQTVLYAPDEFRIADHDPVLVDLALTNLPPSANAGGPYSGDEGTLIALTATGSDPEGLLVTFAWDLDNNGSFESPGATVNFSAVDGPAVATVKLQVTDGSGQSTVAETTVTVNNVAPSVGAIVAPAGPVAVGAPANTAASFTDPGILDTHTALWAWGDGTTSAGVVSESNGSGSVTGSHAYAAAGIYTVSLTVTDKEGAATTVTYQSIVVYDPAAGRVTGGGWINSPAGAFVANPAVAGKLHVNAEVRYETGASLPSGQVKVKFQAAGLDFAGTAIDWMVVSGGTAQIQAVGTINGGGSYRVLLTIGDGVANGGRADTLRIQISDLNAGGAVIYDVQTTLLGGGNFAIHAGALSAAADGEVTVTMGANGGSLYLPLVGNE